MTDDKLFLRTDVLSPPLRPEVRTAGRRAITALRILIADDEPLSRKRLRNLLANEPAVEVVGECGDGWAAVRAIQDHRPDVVFLEVRLPNLDGFEVLETVGKNRMPAVVFVTADERFAVRAFDVCAADYVLKPCNRERLQRALDNVRRQVANDHPITPVDDVASPAMPHSSRIVVKDEGRLLFLRTEDIDWIEARGNYLRLHVAGKSYPIRVQMNVLERHLDPTLFLRIHRSTIVNIDRIKEMQSRLHGHYVVALCDGSQLMMSASYRKKLPQLLWRKGLSTP